MELRRSLKVLNPPCRYENTLPRMPFDDHWHLIAMPCRYRPAIRSGYSTGAAQRTVWLAISITTMSRGRNPRDEASESRLAVDTLCPWVSLPKEVGHVDSSNESCLDCKY